MKKVIYVEGISLRDFNKLCDYSKTNGIIEYKLIIE